jgi:hypothetical protein
MHEQKKASTRAQVPYWFFCHSRSYQPGYPAAYQVSFITLFCKKHTMLLSQRQESESTELQRNREPSAIIPVMMTAGTQP